MDPDLAEIRLEAQRRLQNEDRATVRASILGKGGVLDGLLYQLRGMTPLERRRRGMVLNQFTAEMKDLLV